MTLLIAIAVAAWGLLLILLLRQGDDSLIQRLLGLPREQSKTAKVLVSILAATSAVVFLAFIMYGASASG
jgi:hypothetical protein